MPNKGLPPNRANRLFGRPPMTEDYTKYPIVDEVRNIQVAKEEEKKKRRKEEVQPEVGEIIREDDLKISLQEKIRADTEERNSRRLRKENFDIYEDQDIEMKEIQIAYLKKTGKGIGKGELFRLMLDTYLKDVRRLLELSND